MLVKPTAESVFAELFRVEEFLSELIENRIVTLYILPFLVGGFRLEKIEKSLGDVVLVIMESEPNVM